MKTESWALADVIQGEIRMQELPEIMGVAPVIDYTYRGLEPPYQIISLSI